MIFDTHIHFNDEKLYSNLDNEYKNALEKGINRFLCVGFDLESSKKAIEIANKYKGVYASVGLIPTEWKQYNKNAINDLRSLLVNKKIKAIGEIGLDYYWENSDEIKIIQKEMFIKQIELANEFNLPVSIHCREAYQDCYDILKSHPVINGGIMHCYAGSLEMAKEFIKLGFMIAFGGTLTFKNSVKTKECLEGLKLENIVFETDAPYLSPVPFRGSINHAEYIEKTVEFACSYLKIDRDLLENLTYKNSLNILHVETNED